MRSSSRLAMSLMVVLLVGLPAFGQRPRPQPRVRPMRPSLPPITLGTASEKTPPIASFQAGGHTFRFTGLSEARNSQWTPLALCVVPPFQRVIPRPRMVHVTEGSGGIPLPGGNIVLLYHLERENLVPLSIWPEEVSTIFSEGESASASQGKGVYIESSWAVGFGSGVEVLTAEVSASIETGIETAAQTVGGTRVTFQQDVSGGYSGNNWVCTEEANVFAVQTQYDCYQFAEDGNPALIVWLDVPRDMTYRVFSLSDWNAYASEKNQDGEFLRNLPTFEPVANFSGNVPAYPSEAGQASLTATGRFRGTHTKLWTGPGLYINREASTLAASYSVSSETWESAERTIGATSEFEVEASGIGGKGSATISRAVGSVYTTELASGHSIAGTWHTSSVHQRLDGGTGSLFDFHFTARPRLCRITYYPGASFGALDQLAARLAMMTRLSGVKLTVRGDSLYVVGFNRPISFFADSPSGAPYSGRLLVLDWNVTDLGKSYRAGDGEIYRLAQSLLENKVLLPIAKPPAQIPQSAFYVQIPWAGLAIAPPSVAPPTLATPNLVIFNPQQIAIQPHPVWWDVNIPWARAAQGPGRGIEAAP